LADLARTIELGSFLLLGKGEQQSNGMEKNSLLANAFEALIAAVYLDKGYAAAFDFIERLFEPLLIDASQVSKGQDFKSRLQETMQSAGKETPSYEVVKETGPDHDKTFHVVMRLDDIETRGRGKSKKTAEQDAARTALKLIKKNESTS
jgi:dsRNA-specific ribonuclease